MASHHPTLPGSRTLPFRADNSLAWLAAIVFVWGWTWLHLAQEWSANDQYQYGFAVPLLGLYLAWERWRTRPSLNPGRSVDTLAPKTWRFWLVLALGGSLFVLAELIRQQDPTWRMAAGLFMAAATLLSILWLLALGGPVLLFHFLFPMFFFWVALPWPRIVENWMTANMLRSLTSVAVQGLNGFGIAAFQHGNVIELARGVVGVDTACSGVQSFQASLMAALFLGEFYRLTTLRRLVLVAGGLLAALAGNLARLFTLTWVMHQSGAVALEKMHDPVGFAVTGITFGVIFVLAALLSARARQNRLPAASAGATSVVDLLRSPRWSGSGAVVLGLLLGTPLLVHSWFSWVTRDQLPLPVDPIWQVKSTGLPAGWIVQPERILPREKKILKFTRGQAIAISIPARASARVFHFFWKRGARVPSPDFTHTPDICMRSAGWQQIAAPQPILVTISGQPQPANLYKFRQDNLQQWVIQSIFPEPFFTHSYPVLDRKSHFALLWKAPRQRVQEVLIAYFAVRPSESVEFLAQVLSESVELTPRLQASPGGRSTAAEK